MQEFLYLMTYAKPSLRVRAEACIWWAVQAIVAQKEAELEQMRQKMAVPEHFLLAEQDQPDLDQTAASHPEKFYMAGRCVYNLICCFTSQDLLRLPSCDLCTETRGSPWTGQSCVICSVLPRLAYLWHVQNAGWPDTSDSGSC